MRIFLPVLIVASIGVSVHAQAAAADSSKPKTEQGLSVSLDVGPVSVKADAGSTDGTSVESSVSAPSTSVEATVVPAADAVEPLEQAVLDTENDPSAAGEIVSAATQVPGQTTVQASLPGASATVDVDKAEGIRASVTTPVARAEAGLSTRSGTVNAQVSTPDAVSTRAAAADTVHTTTVPKPAAIAAPAPSLRKPAKSALAVPVRRSASSTVTPAGARILLPARTSALAGLPRHEATASLPRALPLGLSLDQLGAASSATTRSTAKAPWRRLPAPLQSGYDAGSGSGPSSTFFAVLCFSLMLAALVLGPSLRPGNTLAPQPAFASLPERPG